MAETSTRRPYRGSCMCGSIQYIAFLRLPHILTPQPADGHSGQTFLRCNCTYCHKAGVFHTRVLSPPDDFLLLSPLDPFAELGDFQSGLVERGIHWLFCKNCGVRCFSFIGDGDVVDVDLDGLGVRGKDGEKMGVQKAWKPKDQGWLDMEAPDHSYLSINAYTIDAGQEGFDLRELTEKKLVKYVDCLSFETDDRYDRPHVSGAY